MKMYHSVPNTKLPAYQAKQVVGIRLKRANDIVDIEDFEEEMESQEDQFDRDDEYMQVEEPEESIQQLDYYLENFGSQDNPIIFQGELYRFKPGI